MKVCVVGMGYVGLPLACEFAKCGYEVVGIDIDKEKVRRINEGKSTIKGNEPGLSEMVSDAVKKGKMRACMDFSECRDADAVVICIQTPVNERTKRPMYKALISAVKMVGQNMSRGTLVIIESTIMPGTMEKIVKPLLEKSSGLKEGKEFHLVHVPERVNPGKTILHLETMPRVIGCSEPEGGRMAVELYRGFVKADLDVTDWITAETTKTVENAYRDVEIAFANELALICEHLGVDFARVRELVNKVPARNVHLAGPGVGGHCIPKDPWLVISALRGKYKPRLMLTARRINTMMPGHVVNLVMKAMKGRDIRKSVVAILGYAYKEGSEDTRNTPAEPVRKRLMKIAGEVRVHDPYAEGEFIEKDLEKVLRGADCLLLITAHEEYRTLTPEVLRGLMRTPIIVDTRGVFDRTRFKGFTYMGLGRGDARIVE